MIVPGGRVDTLAERVRPEDRSWHVEAAVIASVGLPDDVFPSVYSRRFGLDLRLSWVFCHGVGER